MIYTYHNCSFKINDNITIHPIKFFLDCLLLNNLRIEQLVKNEGYTRGLSGKNNPASENTWLRVRKG